MTSIRFHGGSPAGKYIPEQTGVVNLVNVPITANWSAESAVLTPSAGQWDARFASSAPATMLKSGSTLIMFYVGADGNRADGGPANRGLGMATSTDDGVTWTKYASNPVIPWSGINAFADNEEGVWGASAYIDGDTVLMYVSELTGSGGSVDGAIVQWTCPLADILTPTFTRGVEVLSASVFGSSEKKVGAIFKDKAGEWSCYYIAKQGTVTDWSLHRAYGTSSTSFTTNEEITAKSKTDVALINMTTDAIILGDTGTNATVLIGIGEFGGGIDALSFSESDMATETLETHWAFATFSPNLYLDRPNSKWYLLYGDSTDNPAEINMRTATMVVS